MLLQLLARRREARNTPAVKHRAPVATFSIDGRAVWNPLSRLKAQEDLTFTRLAPLIERCSIDNGIWRIRGIHPTFVFAKRQTVSAVNIALDNLRGEIVIDAH